MEAQHEAYNPYDKMMSMAMLMIDHHAQAPADQEEGISMAPESMTSEMPPGGSEAAGNGRASKAQESVREEIEASSHYRDPSLYGWANDGAAPRSQEGEISILFHKDFDTIDDLLSSVEIVTQWHKWYHTTVVMKLFK